MLFRSMEIEIKAKVDDVEEIKKKLINLGCSFKELRQMDRYFLKKGRREQFKQRLPGEYSLRIRNNDKKDFFFTCKELTDKDGVWPENETRITNPEETEQIILKTGHEYLLTLNKKRFVSKLSEFEVCIDDIEHLGTFIEVEVISDDVDSGQQKILSFFKELGIDESKITHKGYVDMTLRKND